MSWLSDRHEYLMRYAPEPPSPGTIVPALGSLGALGAGSFAAVADLPQSVSVGLAGILASVLIPVAVSAITQRGKRLIAETVERASVNRERADRLESEGRARDREHADALARVSQLHREETARMIDRMADVLEKRRMESEREREEASRMFDRMVEAMGLAARRGENGGE